MAQQQDGLPALQFFATCVNAIRTLPVLQRDKRRPEDCDTHGEDHAADAIRYFCMTQAALEFFDDSADDSSPYRMQAGARPTAKDMNQQAFENALAAAQGRIAGRPSLFRSPRHQRGNR